MTVDEVYEGVKKHQENYPTHGYACSCMDSYIREMRTMLHAHNPIDEVENKDLDKYYSSNEFKIVQRWAYVLKVALRNI